MSAFLQSQMRSRAENVQALSNALDETKGGYFDEIKSRAEDAYNLNLEDYADELNAAISKQVAQKSEGMNVILQSPVFYSSGKSFYGSLGERGQRPFDYVGENVQRITGDRLKEFVEGVENTKDNAKQLLQDVKENVKGKIEKKFAKPDQPLVEDIDGVSRVNLLDAERAAGVPNINLSANEMRTLRTSDLKGVKTKPENEVDPIEPVDPSKSSTVLDKDEIFQSSSEADEALQQTAESTLERSVVESGAEIGAEEGALAATEGALTASGVGAPVAGAIAVAAGIGYGLYEIFGHHSHKPKTPNMPDFNPKPFQSQYSPGSSVLSNVSNVVNPVQGTLSF